MERFSAKMMEAINNREKTQGSPVKSTGSREREVCTEDGAEDRI
jgi:hypothetical protein